MSIAEIDKPIPRRSLIIERTAMDQLDQNLSSKIHAVHREHDSLTHLVEMQMKIARGLTIHGLLAGIVIALGIPLIVLNLAPYSEWMHWVVICSAAITGSGIIIVSTAVVIIGFLRTSRHLAKILERNQSP